MKEWYLYIIKTRDDKLYTGITTDVNRRFDEHQNKKLGAKFLKGKGPLVLLFSEKVGSKSQAASLEYKVKKLSRNKKEQVVNGSLALFDLR